MTSLLEKRMAPRRNTMLLGKIVYDGGRVRIDCLVRNISDTGAKIQVTSVARIPRTFDLVLPKIRPQSCVVVWRTLKELGVRFPKF